MPDTRTHAQHGEDGLGGVEGLLSASDAPVKAKMADATTKICIIELAKACEALKPGEKLNLVATGSLTNVALFLSAFPVRTDPIHGYLEEV